MSSGRSGPGTPPWPGAVRPGAGPGEGAAGAVAATCPRRSGRRPSARRRAAGVRASGRRTRERRRRGGRRPCRARPRTMCGDLPGVPRGRAAKGATAGAGDSSTRRGTVGASCAGAGAVAGTPAAASAWSHRVGGGRGGSCNRRGRCRIGRRRRRGGLGAGELRMPSTRLQVPDHGSLGRCAGPGATASTCAKAELTAVVTSATPGGEPAARATPGATNAPQAAATKTQREVKMACLCAFAAKSSRRASSPDPRPERRDVGRADAQQHREQTPRAS